MSHSIHLYLQRNDFDEIISMISSARCTIISNKGEVLKEPKFDSIKDQVFNIFSSETVQENRFSFCQTDNYDHITVTQQRVLGGMLQPMSIILVSHQHDDAKKNEVISLYNGIKKHIKKNYVILFDAYYISVFIYLILYFLFLTIEGNSFCTLNGKFKGNFNFIFF